MTAFLSHDSRASSPTLVMSLCIMPVDEAEVLGGPRTTPRWCSGSATHEIGDVFGVAGWLADRLAGWLTG